MNVDYGKFVSVIIPDVKVIEDFYNRHNGQYRIDMNKFTAYTDEWFIEQRRLEKLLIYPLMQDGECDPTMVLCSVQDFKPLLDSLNINPYDATLIWFIIKK